VELRHLRYFVAVAEELHFGRAAARLNIAQPALSQQIKQLERELGALLLARTKRRVALTEPGRLFLAEARRTLTQAALAVDVARGAEAGEVGRLRVGYVDAALWGPLPEVIRAFRERFPRVTLTMLERMPAEQPADLRRGDIDLAIGPPPPADAPVETTPFTEEAVTVALPAAHPLASGEAIAIGELADDPWVLVPARVPSQLRNVALRAAAAAGFTPRVAQEARELDTLIALVSAGLGVTLAPASAARLPRPGVVFRPLVGESLSFRLVALRRRGLAPPAVRSFLEVLREVGRAQGRASARA
jgi:DNA-binding transcriptional LysR family regulator